MDESEAQENKETNILGDPATLLQRLGFYDSNTFYFKGIVQQEGSDWIFFWIKAIDAVI